MGRYKEPEYRPHPLLEELRPRLKASARKHLEKSILRVGQLHPVLVTMDHYILDGRERFELMTRQGLKPQIRQLYFYSGVDAKALPNAGFNLEEELQSSREVIEETGRGKWQNSQARRGVDHELIKQEADHELIKQEADHELIKQEADHELIKRLPKIELLQSIPLEGNPIGVRFQRHLLEHLQLQALKTGATGKRGRGKVKVPSVAAYIRSLCWEDFIKHLPAPS